MKLISKKIICALSIVIIVGFLLGFIVPLQHIISNGYIQYQMFRMIAFIFQESLNKWTLITFISLLAVFLIYFLYRLLLYNSKTRMLLGYIACLLFLLCGGWAINHYWLHFRLNSLSLLGNAGILVVTIFLWFILIKIKKENVNKITNTLFKVAGRKYINKFAFGLISFLIILNISIVVDGKINSPKKYNVVWILIDALRADHLGAYDYERDTSPFIDKFADESILFKYAFSQESYTQASVPSYFTSTYPLEHKVLYDQPNVEILDLKFVTIAEILKNANYDTAAFVFNPHLKAKFNFGQGFDLYDDNKKGFDTSLPLYEAYETAEKIFNKLNRYLSGNKKRPLFLYLHYRDVHSPYVPPPPYHKTFLTPVLEPTVDIIYNNRVPFKKQYADIFISQYDGEIKYTDQYIKKTMTLLKDNNINLENSIIIITADHGEEFFDYHPEDKPGEQHGRTLYMEQIHVPLIISIPNINAPQKIINSKVELVDIAPTVLDILDINFEKYNQFQGKSLLPLIKGDDINSFTVYSGGNHGRGVILKGDWKYYYFDKFPKDHRRETFTKPSNDYNYTYGEELYNLKTDPKETRNLINTEINIALKLKEELLIYNNKLGSEGDSKSIKLDSQTMEQLKSLGYIQ